MTEQEHIVERTARNLDLLNEYNYDKEHCRALLNEMKKQLILHGVSSSYSKEDLCVAFEQARCNKHSFEDWYKFNY